MPETDRHWLFGKRCTVLDIPCIPGDIESVVISASHLGTKIVVQEGTERSDRHFKMKLGFHTSLDHLMCYLIIMLYAVRHQRRQQNASFVQYSKICTKFVEEMPLSFALHPLIHCDWITHVIPWVRDKKQGKKISFPLLTWTRGFMKCTDEMGLSGKL